MTMAADDFASIRSLLTNLHAEAKGAGWKRTREGWVLGLYCMYKSSEDQIQ